MCAVLGCALPCYDKCMAKHQLPLPLRQQYLVEEISAVLQDTTHWEFYRLVAERLHHQFIWKVLSEIKSESPTEIGDPVVYFITHMHRAAEAAGIDLQP
jgi:hypothetical protein